MKPDGKKKTSVRDVLLLIVLCIVSYVLGMWHGASKINQADAAHPASSVRAEEDSSTDGAQQAAADAGENKEPTHPREISSASAKEQMHIESEQKRRLMRNLSENLAMPGMSRIIRDQQRVLMAEQFRGLIETLELNEEEKEYLIDLLTARQMYHVDMGMKLMTGMLSEDERNELLKRVGAGIEELNEEIDWFLNNETDSEYFDFYERTEGERAIVDSISAQLTQSGSPLDDGADRELVAILHEELSSYPFSVEFEENGEPVFSRFTAENIDTFVSEMENLRDPVLQEAARMLDAQQLEVLAGSFDQYVAFYDQRMRMVQQLFNPAKQ